MNARGLLLCALLVTGCGGDGGVVIVDDDNTAPICLVSVPRPGDLVSGEVTIVFDVLDGDGDLLGVSTWLSFDGGATFILATAAAGSLPNPATGIAPGNDLVFRWDVAADVARTPQVLLLRIVADDGSASALCELELTAQDDPCLGSPPPTFCELGRATTSTVSGVLGLQLNTGVGCASALRAEFELSTDGGASFFAATDAGSGTTGGNPTAAFPPGASDWAWDSAADIPGAVAGAILRATVRDASDPQAQTVCSVVVDVDNRSAPTCIVHSPRTGETLIDSSELPVRYRLFDAQSDPTDVAIEFSTDGGATFAAASESPPGSTSDGLTGLATGPGGIDHVFAWDAAADLPRAALPLAVVLRLVPADDLAGAACSTGPFTVDSGNSAPTCSQLVVNGTSGIVEILFDLDDADMDPLQLLIEYESPPGSGFVAATADAGSPLANPAQAVPSPSTGLTFAWNTYADIGFWMQDAHVRISVGDPLHPTVPGCATTTPILIDNETRVFESIVVLGPGSPLGAGPNVVGGGYVPSDPCSNADPASSFTFSQGTNRGELTPGVSLLGGNNPLIFDSHGQSMQLVVQGGFSGLGPDLVDIAAASTSDGCTIYTVNSGAGGPYVSVDANGLVTSLLVTATGMSGCDLVDVQFVPTGMSMSGAGSIGMPRVGTFAACIDYFGWDDASRNGSGLMPVGALDATMPGTPSGEPPPGVGGRIHLSVYGKANPTDIASAFDFRMAYDPAFLEPDPAYGIVGVLQCVSLSSPWTVTPSPMHAGTNFLVNGFRVTQDMGSSPLCTMAFTRIGTGATTLLGTQSEWADAMAMRIVGPQPLPWVNPGLSCGVLLP